MKKPSRHHLRIRLRYQHRGAAVSIRRPMQLTSAAVTGETPYLAPRSKLTSTLKFDQKSPLKYLPPSAFRTCVCSLPSPSSWFPTSFPPSPSPPPSAVLISRGLFRTSSASALPLSLSIAFVFSMIACSPPIAPTKPSSLLSLDEISTLRALAPFLLRGGAGLGNTQASAERWHGVQGAIRSHFTFRCRQLTQLSRLGSRGAGA